MTDSTAYWIWAQHVFGEGNYVPYYIHTTFPGGLEGFFKAGMAVWSRMEFISPQRINAMTAFTPQMAAIYLEMLSRIGLEVTTPECEKYPQALRNISDPPAVLYVKGNLDLLDSCPKIAIAGARKATRETLAAAEKISGQLALGGAVIVTGDARGVDSTAIGGAHWTSGSVMSFRSVSQVSVYPTSSVSLRKTIVERGGVIISEYSSQETPAKGSFQERNRLITGISDAVVLFQAAMKSGTMIYGRHALKQKKPLFIYTGPPGDPNYEGSRALIESGGIPVSSGDEIMAVLRRGPAAAAFPIPAKAPAEPEFEAGFEPAFEPDYGRDTGQECSAELRRLPKNNPPPEERAEPPKPQRLHSLQKKRALNSSKPDGAGKSELLKVGQPNTSAPADMLMSLLSSGDKTQEQLCELSGMETQVLLRALTRLELLGKVVRLSGRCYRLVDR